MEMTIADIAKAIKGKIVGNASVVIQGVTNHTHPLSDYITFIEKKRLLPELEDSSIACIIVPHDITSSSKTLIQVDNPRYAFAQIMQCFYPARKYTPGISPHASIATATKIGNNVTIEDFVVIADGVQIGDNSVIRAHTYVDKNVSIGSNTVIHPHVMIYDTCHIGNNVLIHSSTVIGSDGFGFVRDKDGVHLKVPQTGNVIIEDNVEIGSNVSIDRATFGSTVIRRGAKIDNLVQIAHNCEVGENTAVSGHAGMAGSSKLGKNCTIAAQVGIGDHAVIEDNVTIGGQSGVSSKKKIPRDQIYMGSPARPIESFIKQQGINAKLPHMVKEIKELKELAKKIENL